jgi:hypothetical protein
MDQVTAQALTVYKKIVATSTPALVTATANSLPLPSTSAVAVPLPR